MNKEKEELKSLSVPELQERVEALRRELFGLKLTAITQHIKDYSQFKKIKKNIARALTYAKAKSQAER